MGNLKPPRPRVGDQFAAVNVFRHFRGGCFLGSHRPFGRYKKCRNTNQSQHCSHKIILPEDAEPMVILYAHVSNASKAAREASVSVTADASDCGITVIEESDDR